MGLETTDEMKKEVRTVWIKDGILPVCSNRCFEPERMALVASRLSASACKDVRDSVLMAAEKLES